MGGKGDERIFKTMPLACLAFPSISRPIHAFSPKDLHLTELSHCLTGVYMLQGIGSYNQVSMLPGMAGTWSFGGVRRDYDERRQSEPRT